MCTIILGVRVEDDELSWTIAANRDERLDRPSASPRVIEDAGHRILTPEDLVYGGTWLGINDRGLLVALTNRDEAEGNLPVPPSTPLPLLRSFVSGLRAAAGKALPPPRLTSDSLSDRSESSTTFRSRGLLVRDALQVATAEEATALAADTALQHKHFHLVAADRSEAQLVVRGGDGVRRERLARGWHVITEQSFGADADRRGAWLRERIAAQPATTLGYPLDAPLGWHGRVPTPSVGLRTLVELLGTHLAGNPFDSPCVETVHRGHAYGTRSFFVATFDPYNAESIVWWTHEGPTCAVDPKAFGYGATFSLVSTRNPSPSNSPSQREGEKKKEHLPSQREGEKTETDFSPSTAVEGERAGEAHPKGGTP